MEVATGSAGGHSAPVFQGRSSRHRPMQLPKTWEERQREREEQERQQMSHKGRECDQDIRETASEKKRQAHQRRDHCGDRVGFQRVVKQIETEERARRARQ